MTEHIKNPCIGYCLLNQDNICGGCGRTKDERTDWIFLNNDEKLTIIENSEKRLAEIKQAEK
ncbi:DUF1289 domain-containing protein [Catenovulum maritimum]|uniref:Fe-S oxidoreductase n=1 Tax=Catenovulum maritimum TaxID=1513271 RepID=A0A0J8JGY0_9ALTE|nr:DUF1289 domain-containing protein [Catenovulum maritimum]KMT63646.1 hypothetical protein XM47_18595 [Catenovulum maritimum]